LSGFFGITGKMKYGNVDCSGFSRACRQIE